MFEGFGLAIETSAIGLSALPWIAILVDFAYPELRLLSGIRQALAGLGAPRLSDLGKLPGVALLGFLVTYFLALIITPIADEFFNYDWLLPATSVIASKSDQRIRVERYVHEYKALGSFDPTQPSKDEVARWLAFVPRRTPTKRDPDATACHAADRCDQATKALYDRQKFILLQSTESAAVLKDLKDKLVALRGGTWNGLMILFASLGALGAALQPGRRGWGRLASACAPVALVVAFAGWSAREQVGNPRADVLVSAFPFVGICVVASLIALFRKPHAAAPANYLPFLVLGFLLTAGGGFGVNWLEAEYDKHVILLYEYKPANTLAPVAAQSGQPQNRTDSEDVDGRK